MTVTYRLIGECLPALAGAVVDVVDIGANPIDGSPPYAGLLAAGRATVVGFEPAPKAFAELQRRKGPHERYFQLAVGDGREHTLHVCASSGMTSVLEPNTALLAEFHGFSGWAEVIAKERVKTTRLDDIDAIENIDFLKMDIQGFELTVLENGKKKLADAVLLQLEVEFLPLYVGQPLFADVDAFLRSQGFVLHRFWPLKSRTVRPMLVNGDIFASLGQIFDADAVYVPDFSRWPELSERKLEALAVLLHDVYGSFDLVLRALDALDAKRGTRLGDEYLAALGSTPGGARFSRA